jgi:hypothetical protein
LQRHTKQTKSLNSKSTLSWRSYCTIFWALPTLFLISSHHCKVRKAFSSTGGKEVNYQQQYNRQRAPWKVQLNRACAKRPLIFAICTNVPVS